MSPVPSATTPRKRTSKPTAPSLAPAPRVPTILDVMADPKLLGPHFADGDWSAWRAFLAAAFGLPLDEVAFAIYQHHTGRTDRPVLPFTEVALPIGRRGGKSRILALIAVYLAAFRDYRPHLVAGEVATLAILAADRKQARTILRYVTGMLTETPLLSPLVAEVNAESIVLTKRVTIEVATASLRTTRGYTFAAVLCDEIAFWRVDEGSAEPDTEILAALRPGMGTIPGAMLLLASSPYARRGALWDRYKAHHGHDGAPILVWQAATLDMHPTFDRAIVEQAYADDPARAAAEYGGLFRTDVAAFISREVVEGVIEPGLHEIPPAPGTSYAAFVDPSGGRSDSMCLAIAHREDEAGVLDVVREVPPPFSPDAVVAEFAALLKRYDVHTVQGDRYAGEWPVEAFHKVGITYEQAARPKSDLYRELLPILNAGRCRLLDLPRLTTQLCSLERRTARGGRDSVDHAPGAHDDLANVVAGVLVATAGAEDTNAIWAKLGADGPALRNNLSGGWRLPSF